MLKNNSLLLAERSYTPHKLLEIGSEISTSFKNVIIKGYADLNKLENPMFGKIKSYLTDSGVKTNIGDFGSNVNTYSL